MEEDVAIAGRGGAFIRKGARRLECCRQAHGGVGDGRATPPPDSGKVSPLDQYTRGLVDMTNASLQRGRQG
jgi:hypothetical protein